MTDTRAGAPIPYGHGEPVPLGRVEEEIARLWQEAGEEQRGEGQPLTRACLWNLVVVHPSEESGASVERTHRLLNSVVQAVPSRVIRLQTGGGIGAAPPGTEVSAYVSALCHFSPEGGKQVCAEEVRLVAPGDAGPRHFPGLVRALLVPDLPVALLWLDGLPQRGRLLRQLLSLSDRVLVDTQLTGRPRALRDMHTLVAETHADFVDLGWLRLNPVRYLVAGMFDPRGESRRLEALERIRVETTPGSRSEGFLMLGWLLSRLGAELVRVQDVPEDGPECRWKCHRDGWRFLAEFDVREGPGGLDGLLLTEIEAGDARYALQQVDALHVALDSPHRTEQRLALHGWDDPELLVAALGAHGRDRLYPGALRMAALLIEAQAWNE